MNFDPLSIELCTEDDKECEEFVKREILRIGIRAEIDAINLYENLSKYSSGNLRKLLLDIAKEEKRHIGEFQALLLKYDNEQKSELEKGSDELENLFRG